MKQKSLQKQSMPGITRPLLALVLGFAMAAPSLSAAQAAPAIKDGKVAKLACVGDSITEGFGATKGKAELIPDKIHPNDAGQTIIAKTVYKALTGKPAVETTPENSK